jgi:hypothetical protein
VSADRTDDGEDLEPAPDRPLPADPGRERNGETRDRAELPAVNEALDRAVGELASENADLYKRIDALESKIKAEQGKFSAWAKEIAVRDDERAARDEARDRREEALTDRIAELELRLADRPAAADPGGSEPRVDQQEPPGRQTVKRNPERLWRANEAIAVYVSGSGTLLTAAAEVVGTRPVADATGLAGSLAGLAAAAVALARKRREASNADRPQS